MPSAHSIPELDKKGLREFGLTTGAIVAGLFGVFFPWLLEFDFPVWPWIVFGVLAAWALIAPNSMKSVYGLWMRFGMLLGSITSPIVLTTVYFLVFTPTALIMRLFRHDPLNRSIERDKLSYRVEIEKPKTENLEKPF